MFNSSTVHHGIPKFVSKPPQSPWGVSREMCKESFGKTKGAMFTQQFPLFNSFGKTSQLFNCVSMFTQQFPPGKKKNLVPISAQRPFPCACRKSSSQWEVEFGLLSEDKLLHYPICPMYGIFTSKTGWFLGSMLGFIFQTWSIWYAWFMSVPRRFTLW